MIWIFTLTAGSKWILVYPINLSIHDVYQKVVALSSFSHSLNMKNSAVAIVPPLDSLFERLTVCFVCYPPSVAWRDGTSRVVFDLQHQVAFLGQGLRVRLMKVLWCLVFVDY